MPFHRVVFRMLVHLEVIRFIPHAGPHAAILPLLPRRLQLPIPFRAGGYAPGGAGRPRPHGPQVEIHSFRSKTVPFSML